MDVASTCAVSWWQQLGPSWLLLRIGVVAADLVSTKQWGSALHTLWLYMGLLPAVVLSIIYITWSHGEPIQLGR